MRWGSKFPANAEEQARALRKAAGLLLEELREKPEAVRIGARALAGLLARSGWRWGAAVLAATGEPEKSSSPIAGLEVWRALPQWEDEAPPDKPGSLPVAVGETRARLAQLVGDAGEARIEQGDYAEAAAYAFGPRDAAGAPKVALLEAGTGIGKTLGYLAPASLWAEKNGPGLWISTYTRNLQRQIVQELARLYPDPAEREEKMVVRKGRENYLCLLNFEDAAKRSALAPGQRTVSLGLIARWIAATSDGDISGAGFPAFLAASFPVREITDRRGECIYAACPHYRTCFIERAIRRSRHASIVVANHALVIAQAVAGLARGRRDDGHAARTARALCVRRRPSPVRCGRFRISRRSSPAPRWPICGAGSAAPKAARARRMRGLQERLKDLIEDDPAAQSALEETLAASGALAGRRLDGARGRRRSARTRRIVPRRRLPACARPNRRSRCVLFAGSGHRTAGRRHDCGCARVGRQHEADRGAAGASREIPARADREQIRRAGKLQPWPHRSRGPRA